MCLIGVANLKMRTTHFKLPGPNLLTCRLLRSKIYSLNYFEFAYSNIVIYELDNVKMNEGPTQVEVLALDWDQEVRQPYPTNLKPTNLKTTNSQPIANQQPASSQPTASQQLNQQPVNSQPTANLQQTTSQPTASQQLNQQPINNHPTAKSKGNQKPANSQTAAHQQPTSSQPTAKQQPINSKITAILILQGIERCCNSIFT